jgi:hypothetical protein
VREKNTLGSVERFQNGAPRKRSDRRNGTPYGWQSDDVDSTPSGRNLRNVWTIPTQPFPEAHFATFPEALVKRCLLAGTSHKACEVCGAAWERVVEPSDEYKNKLGKGKIYTYAKSGETGLSTIDTGGRSNKSVIPEYNTLGFRSTCHHTGDESTGKCVVLDPFMGSGTVAKVAQELGRDWIGVDINSEYKDIALKRLQGATIGLPFGA